MLPDREGVLDLGRKLVEGDVHAERSARIALREQRLEGAPRLQHIRLVKVDGNVYLLAVLEDIRLIHRKIRPPRLHDKLQIVGYLQELLLLLGLIDLFLVLVGGKSADDQRDNQEQEKDNAEFGEQPPALCVGFHGAVFSPCVEFGVYAATLSKRYARTV